MGANGAASLRGLIDERPVSFDLKLECDPEEVGLLSEALGATVERGGRPAEVRVGSAALAASVIDIRSGTPRQSAARWKSVCSGPSKWPEGT